MIIMLCFKQMVMLVVIIHQLGSVVTLSSKLVYLYPVTAPTTTTTDQPVSTRPTSNYLKSCSSFSLKIPFFTNYSFALMLPSTGVCDSGMICYGGLCQCSAEHVYSSLLDRCVPLLAPCQQDQQCLVMDANMFCDQHRNKCLCNVGWTMNNKTGRCDQIKPKETTTPDKALWSTLLVNYDSQNSSWEQRNLSEWDYFFLGGSCTKNAECPFSNAYCYRRHCRCWPEFEFVPLARWPTMESGGAYQVANENSSLGYCTRRLCQSDSDCGDSSSRLVCNNTVCKCRYGYTMLADSKVCSRLFGRRQSCDITCKIIGCLFASIFMVTLVYWCLYCCCSLAKSYHGHHRTMAYHDRDSYLINRFRSFDDDDDQHIRTRSGGGTRSASASSSVPPSTATTTTIPHFSINILLRNMTTVHDDPPTYSQVMADEPLPNYDSVVDLHLLDTLLDK